MLTSSTTMIERFGGGPRSIRLEEHFHGLCTLFDDKRFAFLTRDDQRRNKALHCTPLYKLAFTTWRLFFFSPFQDDISKETFFFCVYFTAWFALSALILRIVRLLFARRRSQDSP
jgi:hypothetical protein